MLQPPSVALRQMSTSSEFSVLRMRFNPGLAIVWECSRSRCGNCRQLMLRYAFVCVCVPCCPTIYSWDMQRNQTCKIVEIYHFPPPPWLKKNRGMFHCTKESDLPQNLNSKLREWAINCKIHCFLVGVHNDAVQEHNLTGFRNSSFLHNDIEYMFLIWMTRFWTRKTKSKTKKWEISTGDAESVTIHKDF